MGIYTRHELFGLYRAYVESDIDEDTEERMRVRVRVPQVHPPELPTDALPFAELCQDVGTMRGRFFPYRRGDRVWVAFENGEVAKPIIVGGQINNLRHMSDVPLELQAEPTADLCVETDDAGNAIIFDGRTDRRRIVIRAGSAEVVVTALGDQLILQSSSGSVRISAAEAAIEAGRATVEAQQVHISANYNDILGRDAGTITERANNKIVRVTTPTIPAASNVDAVRGIINDGGEIPTIRGIPAPPGRPLQTNKHNLRARIINIGVGPTGVIVGVGTNDAVQSPFIDQEPNISEAADAAVGGTPSVPYPLLPTLEVNIRSSMAVNVAAPTVAIAGAASLSLLSQGTASISAFGPLSVMAMSSADVFVGGKADVKVGGTASVAVGGKADVTVGGAASLLVGGKADIMVGGRAEVMVGGSMSAKIGGSLDAAIGGSGVIACGGALTISAGSLTLASGSITLVGGVRIYGAVNVFGITVGMTGVMLDLHFHPYVGLSPGTPGITGPPR